MRELLRDTHSVFYWEIQNNQNVSHARYHLPASNRLLYFFFNDIQVAKEIGIYKPVGDFMLLSLDDLTYQPLNDPYNRASDDDFEKSGAWHTPLFAGVQFFDIMVKEALHQAMQWHMWLYYMPLVVERICRNYRLTDPLVDDQFDFPTRYAYILYRIFAVLRDWIRAVENYPQDQANVILKSTSTEHENGNIPKSSILALTQCLYFVLQSQYIEERTKRSLVDLVLSLYLDLLASGKFDDYAKVLIKAVTEQKSYKADSAKYRAAVVAVFDHERSEYYITRNEEHVGALEAAIDRLR